MSLRLLSPFKRRGTTMAEEIKIYTKGYNETAAKVIARAVEMLKAKGAEEKNLVAGFCSILLAFDYTQKRNVMDILGRCGYKGVEAVGGEAAAEVIGGSPGKLKGMSSDAISNETTAVVESSVSTCTERRAMMAMSIAQVLYIMFENSPENVELFWKNVSLHCGMAEKVVQLLDTTNKAKLRNVFWMASCCDSVKKIVYRIMKSLSRKKGVLATTLVEAEYYARANRFEKPPYVPIGSRSHLASGEKKDAVILWCFKVKTVSNHLSV